VVNVPLRFEAAGNLKARREPAMASLIVDGPDLVVRLSPLEKLGAFRGDVHGV
jgi:hypothetical protein